MHNQHDVDTFAEESRLRRRLRAQGFALRRSRISAERACHANDLGGFMIVDTSANCVVAGSNYELSLEDVEAFAAA